MSDYISQVIAGAQQNTLNSIHTSFPARVVAYNEAAHTATVQPLFKYETGEDYPQIQNVPVMRWRYRIMQNEHNTIEDITYPDPPAPPPNAPLHWHPILFEEIIEEIQLLLYPGDIVLCTCSEKSIDSFKSNKVHDPQSKRKFDITDAFVICILYNETWRGHRG